MKILQIHKFFDFRGSGPEVYIPELMRRLEARGHEVHIFSTRSQNDRPTKDRDYFVTRYSLDRREGLFKDTQKAVNFIWNKEAKESLRKMLWDIKPDAIHLHNIYHHLSSSILSVIREYGAVCVQTLHDYKLACPNYKMYTQDALCERCKGGKYYQAVLHQCLFNGRIPNILAAFEMGMTKLVQSYERTVHKFICPSNFMLNKMREWGEPPGKLIYIPNPVDIPSRISAERDTSPYVYIGRLYPEKGVELIIRAIARISEAKLKIAGEGHERNRLEILAQTIAPGRIEFLGYQTGESLNALRSTARALLVPSLWYENAPLTALEALANGVPVIGSDIGGIPELISDGLSGLIAKPNKIDSWIEAICQMQTYTSDQRKAMGDAGREFVSKNMNWDKHLDDLIKIYQG